MNYLFLMLEMFRGSLKSKKYIDCEYCKLKGLIFGLYVCNKRNSKFRF